MFLKKWFVFIFLLSRFNFVKGGFTKEEMTPDNETIIDSSKYGWDVFDNVFEFIRDSFFALIFVVALWVFIYTWAKLVIARWSQDELKKAMMAFIYTAVWLVVVVFSWAIVKIASSINF